MRRKLLSLLLPPCVYPNENTQATNETHTTVNIIIPVFFESFGLNLSNFIRFFMLVLE